MSASTTLRVLLAWPTARSDLPPSRVNLGRTLTLRYLPPRSSISWSRLTLTSVVGEKTMLSPVASSITCLNQASSSPDCTLLTCLLRCSHHEGELKRWQTMKVDRSRIVRGTTVGSWVAIITRVARCRCRRMVLAKDWLRREDSLDVKNLWASSRTIARGMSGRRGKHEISYRRSCHSPLASRQMSPEQYRTEAQRSCLGFLVSLY